VGYILLESLDILSDRGYPAGIKAFFDVFPFIAPNLRDAERSESRFGRKLDGKLVFHD
jgi:hypothetical protein